MRDPYEVLGLAPDATLDDAEHAYHHRLLRCHPDLHTAEGPDAVRRAENETCDLNEAITRLRRGYPPRFGGVGARHAPGASRRARANAGTGTGTGTTTDPNHGFGPSGFGPNGFGTGARHRAPSGPNGGASSFGRPWWSSYGPPREEDPWPGSARTESGRVHRPVACPFCEAPVTSLDAFQVHLHVAHPRIAGPRGRSRRRRRNPAGTRSRWPLPLWQVALLNLILVGVAIAVIAALGGPNAVLVMLPGHYTPDPVCHAGQIVDNQLHVPLPCDPRNTDWAWAMLVLGMGLTGFVWAWRATTGER